jgi:putative tricarboxylic transport membrane protein
MRKADRITGIITLIFSGYVIAASSGMSRQGQSFGPGVGFLPFWLGVVMAILSVLLVLKSGKLPAGETKKIFPARGPLLSIAAVMAGLAVYILLIEVLGFLVDTFLFVVFLLGGVEREKLRMALPVAILTSGALYIIFCVLLEVTLPKNMFGF